jgi:cytochrome c oxidase cbb3-type subunit I/II
MLNGLLTLRGSWEKLRADPVIKFFAAGVTFYGMATFEGPLLAIKSVNALGHYTDWIIGHVHSGALGWNGFMAAGMFYFLLPRLWSKPLHSKALANLHFWIGLVGILLYIGAMWASGITQGVMLNATAENGTVLAYPNFVEVLQTVLPLMAFRVVGGLLYLTGWLTMIYNIIMTLRGAKTVDGSIEVFLDDPHSVPQSHGIAGTLLNPPMIFSVLGIVFACAWMFGNEFVSMAGLVGTMLIAVLAYTHFQTKGDSWGNWYDKLLQSAVPFTVLTFLAVVAGGAIQIIPTILLHNPATVEDRIQVPYTPLELAGRDIYIREGCYLCHSQMIRTMVPDVMRYGDYSRLGESIYDHPYQWGSKRTGPDLARVGSKYNHAWHFDHMEDPRKTTPGSNMPTFPWLYKNNTDIAALTSKIKVQRQLGVPYPEMSAADIANSTSAQSKQIVADLRVQLRNADPDKEIIALISYLQKLGKSEKVKAK